MTIRYDAVPGKAAVEAYLLYEFLSDVQQLTLEGYTLCLENAYFPSNYVGHFLAYFDKPVAEGVLTNNGIEQFPDNLEIKVGENLVVNEPVVINGEEINKINDEVETPRRGRPRNRE